MWKSISNRSVIIIYIYIYILINLLPLRLIFIRTYERDSDRERLREDILLRFRALKCCDFLWTVFLRAFSFFALTLVAMLPESKWLSKVVFNIGVLCTSIDGESQSLETLLFKFLEFMSMDWDSLVTLLLSISFISWSKIQTKVENVSSVISIGVLRSYIICNMYIFNS